MKPKPKCETVLPWLKANLGERCLAPLTGTDARALQAAVQIIELYSYDSDLSVLAAFALVVQRMQPSTQELAYHATAHVMDWSDRARVWVRAGLADCANFRPPRKCAYEPGGLAWTTGEPKPQPVGL